MEERERVAIGTVVMRNKQYLTAIRPLDGVLAMSTMRFADEVVPRADIDELPSLRSKPDSKAVKLALQIVESLAAEWDPNQYHDTYTDQLRKIIERKDAGQDEVVEAAPAQTAQVLDLMAALEASVEAAKSGRTRAGTVRALADTAERLAEEADDDDSAGSDGGAKRGGRRSGSSTGKASTPTSTRSGTGKQTTSKARKRPAGKRPVGKASGAKKGAAKKKSGTRGAGSGSTRRKSA